MTLKNNQGHLTCYFFVEWSETKKAKTVAEVKLQLNVLNLRSEHSRHSQIGHNQRLRVQTIYFFHVRKKTLKYCKTRLFGWRIFHIKKWKKQFFTSLKLRVINKKVKEIPKITHVISLQSLNEFRLKTCQIYFGWHTVRVDSYYECCFCCSSTTSLWLMMSQCKC